MQRSDLTIPCHECPQVPAKEHQRSGQGGTETPKRAGQSSPGLGTHPLALNWVHSLSTGVCIHSSHTCQSPLSNFVSWSKRMPCFCDFPSCVTATHRYPAIHGGLNTTWTFYSAAYSAGGKHVISAGTRLVFRSQLQEQPTCDHEQVTTLLAPRVRICKMG